MTDNNPEILKSNKPGVWTRIVRLNTSGSGSFIMLVIGLAVGFAWGYHTRTQSYKAKGAEIINQSINNKKLDSITSDDMIKRKGELYEALSELGYNNSEIEFLIKGDTSALDKLKETFKRYTTDGELYPPRQDCSDDYLGEKASTKTNEQILKWFEKDE